jgi:hypothetical protein
MSFWGGTFYYASEEEIPPEDSRSRIPIQCPTCGFHTDSEIMGVFTTGQNEFVRLPESHMKLHNYLLRCTRCDSGIFIVWSYGDSRNGRITAGRVIYPLRLEAFELDKLGGKSIPKGIFEDLRQAELAFAAGARYGAGLLLRRACQNICRERNIDGTGLKGQIKMLATSGLITTTLEEMAHHTRIVGDELAHPDPKIPDIISDEDVRAAWEFLTQLVRAIYIDPAKAEKAKSDLHQKGVKRT